MAKKLSNIGIQTGKVIEADHVSQIVKAFTGVEEYNIHLLGSFHLTGSATIDGLTTPPQANIITYNPGTKRLHTTSSAGFLYELSSSLYDISNSIPDIPDVPNFYEEVTYNELINLKNSSEIEPNTMYYIIDRGIILLGISENQLTKNGSRLMEVPRSEFYTPQILNEGGVDLDIRGIYTQTDSEGTYPNSTSSNIIYTIWGGKVWKRDQSNPDGGIISDITLGDGWDLEPITSSVYETQVFFIIYDLENDWISTQICRKNNIVGIGYTTDPHPLAFNPVDHTDWNKEGITNNRVQLGIYNNPSTNIFHNVVAGKISGNTATVRNNTQTSLILNDPSLESNTNNGIINNTGGVNDNYVENYIFNNGASFFDNISISIFDNSSGNIQRNFFPYINNNSEVSIFSNHSNSNSGSISYNVGVNTNNNRIEYNVAPEITNNNLYSNFVIEYNEIFSGSMQGINYNDINGSINENSCINLSYNTINGDISKNKISGEIAYNIRYETTSSLGFDSQAPQNITNNKNQGSITHNSLVGDILSNHNLGDISYNTHTEESTPTISPYPGDIMNITTNRNIGDISYNKISGDISKNNNIGDIKNNGDEVSNIVAREILKNSNSGDISYNEVPIRSNSNEGNISFNIERFNKDLEYIESNFNGGDISNNQIEGIISKNKNNGDIVGNKSLSYKEDINEDPLYEENDSPLSIFNNVNNGTISYNHVEGNQVKIRYNSSCVCDISGTEEDPAIRFFDIYNQECDGITNNYIQYQFSNNNIY